LIRDYENFLLENNLNDNNGEFDPAAEIELEKRIEGELARIRETFIDEQERENLLKQQQKIRSRYEKIASLENVSQADTIMQALQEAKFNGLTMEEIKQSPQWVEKKVDAQKTIINNPDKKEEKVMANEERGDGDGSNHNINHNNNNYGNYHHSNNGASAGGGETVSRDVGEAKIEKTKVFGPPESIELNFLKSKTTPELIEYGKDKVEDISSMYRQEMISAILKQFSESNPENTIIGEGVLEVLPDGFGFLRYSDCNYISSPYDIYVSFAQIKKFALRTGDSIKGTIKAPKKTEKYFSLLRLDAINSQTLEESHHRIRFDDLIPLYPQEKLMLENEELYRHKKDDTCRILDLISPIGKGQRALIVAPPKTGKTTILQNIAHAITKAHSEADLIVLLIDERPEEVTDMARSIKGEVVSSTFDEPATRHVQLAEIVIEKAKRIVETGKDVIILLDSITRLARAYNNVLPSSGKVLTGGVDANALQKPKRFFGAARNIENGGSLTIVATALIETGSKMDEVIFEEFKGTGNSEILLDRKISDRRIFPAVDVIKSSTRREELLIDKLILSKTWMLRKILSSMDSVGAIEFLKEKLNATKNNAEFFRNMNS
jgi:transcription termination factor Rho